MGVPAFFRWLSKKYPKVTAQVIEEQVQDVNGEEIPVDMTKPNPNGVEFDNLYLDMNGIIHPCCHPEDKPAPGTEDEMYVEIFKYIDRIVQMIRPRKLIYMAIDGVAPRAKMNQQRSRRFRAARDERNKQAAEEQIRKDWAKEHDIEFDEEEKSHFDSNCITPGTPFMDRLALCLRYYIAERLNNDPGWKDVKVILSDASVPGEGEHKIMDYIRRQRNVPTYDSNLHHVLYGLDADLIMLAIATHEPHFWILREDVFFNEGKRKACTICGQLGHMAQYCQGKPKEIVGKFNEQDVYIPQKPYIFLSVSILREYLEVELKVHNLKFGWDLERALDDWVFLIFFVGNDFLPHLPSLEIREGAIDKLVEIWKSNLQSWGDYITEAGEIRLDCMQQVMAELGKHEDMVFQKRREDEEGRRVARLRKKKQQRSSLKAKQQRDLEKRNELKRKLMQSEKNLEKEALELFTASTGESANAQAAKKLKMAMGSKKVTEVEEVVEEGGQVEPVQSSSKPSDVKETSKDQEEDSLLESSEQEVDSDEEPPEDDVRLWESGWKIRYYQSKFQVDIGDQAFRKEVVRAYTEGLCWVLRYYYQGVASWHWYYPYHYSPFASDFYLLDDKPVEFTLGRPFNPIEQLMGVLPAASRFHIPRPFHHLMTDGDSEIIDFYPEDFPIDMNGKKHEWQGVALLPFIDADRLVKAMQPYYERLSEDEKRRNARGSEVLVFGKQCPLFDPLCLIYGKQQVDNVFFLILAHSCSNISGGVTKDPNVVIPGTTFDSPLEYLGLPDIGDVQVISFVYHMPQFPSGFRYHARLLPGVRLPNQVLDQQDRQNVKSGYYTNPRARSNYYGQIYETKNRRNESEPREYRNTVQSAGPYMAGGGYGNRNEQGKVLLLILGHSIQLSATRQLSKTG
ncbi:exoribonculease Dhp1 [Gorgonomyces haynaldii]|nr:exoribonculease Dhp1 [Gorgonomyces haynaldii]